MLLPADTPLIRSSKRLPNVITSFNEHGYKVYGKDFIDSFLRFWPASIGLTVYYEGDDFPFTQGLSWKPIEQVEFLTDYMDSLRFPIMHGIVGNEFNMHFDAGQARKVFMEMHTVNTMGGKVFWIDADVVTHAPVPETLLDDLLPDDALCCFLGRDGWYHTESGFIGFNGDSPLMRRFAKMYVHAFITGSIFTQPGWNDCYGFDACRHIFGNGPEFRNLAKDVPHGTMHPFVNTVLGRYMDHRKGRRKESRSTDKDLVIERSEPYWQTKH